jgi:hypothetical protein
MKKIKQFLAAITLLIGGALSAQVSVNVNIGSPPEWGPVGYTDVRYYYLPDVEAYYDIQSSMFIYYGDGIWVHQAYLPQRYSSYDLYYGYKVVMTDYRGDRPYANFNEYKVKYKKGYRGKEQKTIGHNPGKGNHASNNRDSKQAGDKSRESHNSGSNNSPQKRNQVQPHNKTHVAQHSAGGGNKSAGAGNKPQGGQPNHGGGGGGKKR